jgi:hypothetical protein
MKEDQTHRAAIMKPPAMARAPAIGPEVIIAAAPVLESVEVSASL